MRKIRVLLYGIGAVGAMIAKCLLEKEGVEIVGAIDIAEDKTGRDLGDVLGLERKLGVQVSADADAVLSKAEADIAVLATSSYLKDTFPQIASVVKHGVSIVSTCEELAYPYISNQKMAEQLDALAKKHGATILGTGINPGFLMDTLVLTLTAACTSVKKIEATRVLDAANRRLPFQRKVGVGLTLDEFRRQIKEKRISGHVGLEQSIAMVAAGLAWKLDKITAEPPEPVIAEKNVAGGSRKVEAGKVAGLKQRARGTMNGKDVIVLDFEAFVGAEEHDAVMIDGVPIVAEKIQPCVHGDVATVAVVVNSIPRVLCAAAGLVTMKDLPVPHAALGDMRGHVTAQRLRQT